MLGLLLRLPLSVKSGLIAAVLCAITGLTLLISSVTASKQMLLHTTDLVGKHWAVQLASQSQQALLRSDRISLQAIVQDYTSNELVSHVRIDDAQGENLAESGIWQSEGHIYTADIAADIGSLGQVSLGLDGSRVNREIAELGSTLLILSTILCALAYSLAAVPVRKLEEYLRLAKTRLTQPLRNDLSPYSGTDSLGQLLREIHQAEIYALPKQGEQSHEYLVLHCQWQHLAKLQKQMTADALDQQISVSIARAETIARLYHAELIFLRSNAFSLRFFDHPDADEPLFRALCCAELFTKLDSLLKARCGIEQVKVTGDPLHCQLFEAEVVERLHKTTSAGVGTWLAEDLLEHEALSNWVDREDREITAMSPPYDELLARQFTQLQQLYTSND